MAATLRIVDESEYGPEPKDVAIPHGATVTVRRHGQGADVTVLPGETAPVSQAPDRLIAVHGFTVERNRLGCAEVLIQDAQREEWRLFLGGSMGGDLASCLQGSEPNSARDSHEAALARRANAEAQLAELEFAEKTRAARANDRDVCADRLSLDTDEDAGTITLCAAVVGGGPELKVGLRRDQLLWLAQQLLAAYGRLDRRGR